MKHTFTLFTALVLAALSMLHAEEKTDTPTSIEVWLQLYPKGATNEKEAPRGAWSLLADDLRLTQAIDAEGGKSQVLIGPNAGNGDFGDFEDGKHQLNGHLIQTTRVIEGTKETPAASGRKFV